jgi:hypothetical protein
MRKNIRELLENKAVTRFTRIFLATLIIFLGIGVWKWHLLPPQLPLFYSLPKSNDQLGTPLQLLMLPALSVLFFAVSFLVSLRLRKTEILAAELLIMTSSIISIFLLIAFVKIIFLIT